MRELINIINEAETAQDGLKSRYQGLSDEDLCYIAGHYHTAEDFAAHIIDAASPSAARTAQAMVQLWKESEAEGFPEVNDTLRYIGGLEKFIAGRIGATHFKKSLHHGFADAAMIFSPEGYIFTTPNGRIYLDAVVYKGSVCLANILVEGSAKNTGLGTQVMEAIHDFAVENGLGVKVYKATARKFFNKFAWLTPDAHHSNYTMAPGS